METLKQPAMMAAIGNLVLTSGLFVFLNNKIDALGTGAQTNDTRLKTAEDFITAISKESEERHKAYKKQLRKWQTEKDAMTEKATEREKEILYLKEYVDLLVKELQEKNLVSVKPPRKKTAKKAPKQTKKKRVVESSSESESEQEANDPPDSDSESEEEYIPKDMRKKKTRD